MARGVLLAPSSDSWARARQRRSHVTRAKASAPSCCSRWGSRVLRGVGGVGKEGVRVGSCAQAPAAQAREEEDKDRQLRNASKEEAEAGGLCILHQHSCLLLFILAQHTEDEGERTAHAIPAHGAFAHGQLRARPHKHTITLTQHTGEGGGERDGTERVQLPQREANARLVQRLPHVGGCQGES